VPLRSRLIRRPRSRSSSDVVLVQPILVAAFVIAADRSSKTAAANLLGSGKVLTIGNGLRIRCVVTRFRNRGFLDRPAMLLLVWAAALAIIALAISSGMFFQRPLAQMGLAAALAGSASNFYDRWRHGTVIDFLDLGWWPVSNLADIALVLGIAIALRFI
jgi:signal peptidase II